jgi:farnesol dehydrogenase
LVFLLVNGAAGILSLFSLSPSLSETHGVQTDTEMRVLLTGATGFLGGRLCSALVHSGHTVRVTVRANSVTSELPPEVEIANCDIQDAPALIKACEGCDAVIHTAALVGSWLPDSSQFITVNVQGLRNVIDAVKANPSVKKLVYTSSFFALGYTDGHIGDEDQVHPGKFISPYEESKFLADKVAQEAAAEGVPIVSVYPGMVYGPGKLTAGNSLALMVMFQIYQSFLEAQ